MAQQLQAARQTAQPPTVAGRVLQRVCACGKHAEGGECAECKQKRQGMLQRAAVSADPGGAEAPPIVHDVLRSPGQPLDAATRAFMEPRFGHDFGDVRIHTDTRAAASARAVNALAYTVGNHVAFDTGRFQFGSTTGRRLLAHELTHVVQQKRGQTVNVDRLALDGDRLSAQEAEAHRIADRVSTGLPGTTSPVVAPRMVQRQRSGSAGGVPRGVGDPAGGCGICYGGDFGLIGTDVHRQVLAKFEDKYRTIGLITNRLMVAPHQSGGVSEGIPDLWLETPTSILIGELKPANAPAVVRGYVQMGMYILIAQRMLRALGISKRVDTLELSPPAPFLFSQSTLPLLPCVQAINVLRVGFGVYVYHCIPPWSRDLVIRCCRGRRMERRLEPVREPVTAPARQGSEQRSREPTPETSRPPIATPDLVPLGVAAMATAATAWLVKTAARRVTAPATALAAVILVASGAEASVGLEGDDPLEALFELAAQQGTPIPDDLKEAIKADPALRQLLTDAARSGDYSEAQRRLGEQLTRTIVENRDQLSDEDLRELQQLMEQHGEAIPNAPVTAETIRQALNRRGGSQAPGTGDGPSEGPTTDAQPPTTQDSSARPLPVPERPTPAQRLESELVRPGREGPRVDVTSLQRLRSILANADPQLSDVDVDALIPMIQSAEGKSIDEVLLSIERGLANRRPEGIQDAIEQIEPVQDTEGREQSESSDLSMTRSRTYPSTAVNKSLEQKLESRWEDLAPGVWTVLGLVDEVVFVEGQPFHGIIVGRDAATNTIYFGEGGITPRRERGRWMLYVPAGIRLDGPGGFFGTTRQDRVPARRGVGDPPSSRSQ